MEMNLPDEYVEINDVEKQQCGGGCIVVGSWSNWRPTSFNYGPKTTTWSNSRTISDYGLFTTKTTVQTIQTDVKWYRGCLYTNPSMDLEPEDYMADSMTSTSSTKLTSFAKATLCIGPVWAVGMGLEIAAMCGAFN